jgi:hypothetical protein
MSIKQYLCMLIVVIGCAQASLVAYSTTKTMPSSTRYQTKTMPRDKRYSDTVYRNSNIPTNAIECRDRGNQCYCAFKGDYRNRESAEDIGIWVGTEHKCYCQDRDLKYSAGLPSKLRR